MPAGTLGEPGRFSGTGFYTFPRIGGSALASARPPVNPGAGDPAPRGYSGHIGAVGEGNPPQPTGWPCPHPQSLLTLLLPFIEHLLLRTLTRIRHLSLVLKSQSPGSNPDSHSTALGMSFTSLSLSFLTSEMGLVRPPSLGQGEDSGNNRTWATRTTTVLVTTA